MKILNCWDYWIRTMEKIEKDNEWNVHENIWYVLNEMWMKIPAVDDKMSIFYIVDETLVLRDVQTHSSLSCLQEHPVPTYLYITLYPNIYIFTTPYQHTYILTTLYLHIFLVTNLYLHIKMYHTHLYIYHPVLYTFIYLSLCTIHIYIFNTIPTQLYILTPCTCTFIFFPPCTWTFFFLNPFTCR